MSRPIVLYAYNRPHYFEQVLKSLQPQAKETEVFLFNDGPNNRADKRNVARSVELFKKYFPHSTAFESDVNLGVAFNQKRGREFIFDQAESAIFIEDDIVLNDYYIKQLNLLMDKFQNQANIGMVSCFGESHRKSSVFRFCDYIIKHENEYRQQEINQNQFMQMEHLWAYGFYRHAYNNILELINEYYSLLPKLYRSRCEIKIAKYCNKYGIGKCVSSQDSILSGLLLYKGYIKVSTFTMNAKYIGEYGEHSGKAHYEKFWKNYDPYNKFVDNFEWNNEIENKITNILRHQFFSNESLSISN